MNMSDSGNGVYGITNMDHLKIGKIDDSAIFRPIFQTNPSCSWLPIRCAQIRCAPARVGPSPSRQLARVVVKAGISPPPKWLVAAKRGPEMAGI